MINYEIVSIKLFPDYIKGIDFMCTKIKISRESFLRKSVQQLVFENYSLPIDCNVFDELRENIDDVGLKQNISIDDETEWELES